MNRKKFTIQYIISDALSSALAWTLFYIFRKIYVEPAKFEYKIDIRFDENYYIALVAIPIFWLVIYSIVGSYKDIYRKSRLREFALTFVITFLGTLFLFFILLLDDFVRNYKFYRITFTTLFGLQFILLSTTRLVILTMIKRKIRSRKIFFNTLILGSNKKVLELYKEMENEKHSQGYKFVGYVTVKDNPKHFLEPYLKNLGTYKDIKQIIQEQNVEVVILAIDTSEHKKLSELVSNLKEENINIKIIPDMYDLISGMVKMNYIFGTALIDIRTQIMPEWQQNIKRIIDVAFSAFILILLIPFFGFIAIGIKATSKGPVFYRQERVGKNWKKFRIIKFRTMHQNAETGVPQLSHDNDPRVTKIGKFLRKYRLDELPQFINVLKGEMSIIGPRPERQYYIDQIVERAPQYRHLLKVTPGITSWGQIKYGYAENVDQMIQRMKFDILYIENMTLAMDFKIFFYTILIIVKGSGK